VVGPLLHVQLRVQQQRGPRRAPAITIRTPHGDLNIETTGGLAGQQQRGLGVEGVGEVPEDGQGGGLGPEGEGPTWEHTQH
jgi:hypothetical protein